MKTTLMLSGFALNGFIEITAGRKNEFVRLEDLLSIGVSCCPAKLRYENPAGTVNFDATYFTVPGTPTEENINSGMSGDTCQEEGNVHQSETLIRKKIPVIKTIYIFEQNYFLKLSNRTIMKKFISLTVLTVSLALTYFVSFAQGKNEAEIKMLENKEGEAWVKKDSATLFTLFSPKLIVNTPLNRVATLEVIKKLMRAGKIDISSSEKVMEKVSFINDMAVVMGHDIVKPQGQMENAGKTVTREYTDVWIKDKTGWHLTIRQATNISIF